MNWGIVNFFRQSYSKKATVREDTRLFSKNRNKCHDFQNNVVADEVAMRGSAIFFLGDIGFEPMTSNARIARYAARKWIKDSPSANGSYRVKSPCGGEI